MYINRRIPAKTNWHRNYRIIRGQKSKSFKNETSCNKCITNTRNLIAMGVSLLICSWQVTVCLVNYYNKPITTDISIENLNKFSFPIFYICPFNVTDEMVNVFRAICKRYDSCNALSKEMSYDYKFKELNTTFEYIWQQNSVKNIISLLNCDSATNKSHCRKWYQDESFRNDSVSYLDTIRGKCQIFDSSEIQWYLIGKSNTFWRIGLFSNILMNNKNVPALLSLSAEPYKDKYLIPEETLNINTLTVLEITGLKEFHRVNSTSTKTCISRHEYVDCVNDCLDKEINEYLKKKTTKAVPCVLPFINLSEVTNKCSTLKEVLHIFNWIETKTFEREHCNCQISCKKISYSILTKRRPIHAMGIYSPMPNLRLNIRFSVNFKDVITERYMITLADLFSSLAGNIGFYIGISLFGIIQYISTSLILISNFFSSKVVKPIVTNRKDREKFYTDVYNFKR